MRPIWTVDRRSLAILALIAAAYIVAIWILLRGERRGRQQRGLQVLLVCGTAFVPVLLAVLALPSGLLEIRRPHLAVSRTRSVCGLHSPFTAGIASG